MKTILKLFFLTIILFSLIACGEPPENIKTISVLDWISNILPKLNEINLDEERQKIFIEKEIQSKKQLIVFHKGQSIHLHTKQDKTSDLFYSLDNNGFILKKPVYVTYEKKDMYISLDKRKWILLKPFSTESDFEIDYKFESNINKNKIDIYFSNTAIIKDKLKNVKILKQQKPIKKLDSKMILKDDKNKNLLSIDLNKSILYIPENTILTGNLKISGNILTALKSSDTLIITALRDIYVYINNKMLNLSFDRQTWGLATILSLKFNPNIQVKSKEKNTIYFCVDIEVSYKE